MAKKSVKLDKISFVQVFLSTPNAFHVDAAVRFPARKHGTSKYTRKQKHKNKEN